MTDTPRTYAFCSKIAKDYKDDWNRWQLTANFAAELERELAVAKEQWRMSSVCRELRAELDRERTLADGLAEVLDGLDWMGSSPPQALAAWKAARIDAHLDECVAKSAESWKPLPGDPEQFYPR